MAEGTKIRTYFPNLDALRFLGALAIMLIHTGGISARNGGGISRFEQYIHNYGHPAVSMFFVLSGFLITYLLLNEKKETGTIDLKGYYVRRTLRIWPLYFLILVIGFFILPLVLPGVSNKFDGVIHRHYWVYLIGCIFFLSPLLKGFGGMPETFGPIWSVGVEELFYLCWPVFLRKAKNVAFLLIGVVAAVICLRNGFFIGVHLTGLKFSHPHIFYSLLEIIMEYRFSCMAIGGLAAYLLLSDRKEILNLLYRKDLQYGVYVFTIVLLIFRIGIKNPANEKFISVGHEVYAVLFAYFILNLAANPNSVLNLNYKWLNYLGKISYGIYLYHPLMRVLMFVSIQQIWGEQEMSKPVIILFYLATIVTTILSAMLSYEFFEKRFLNLKTKFLKPQA